MKQKNKLINTRKQLNQTEVHKYESYSNNEDDYIEEDIGINFE